MTITEPRPGRDRWPSPEPKWGVGLRRPHFDEIFENNDGVDFLEVISENFMNFGGRPKTVLARARDRFPVIAHGVGMSIAGPDPLDKEYLKDLKSFLDWLDPPWYSDHLSYSSGYGVQYHDKIPFPFCEEALAHVSQRVIRVQETLNRPFLLENSSYYISFSGSNMSEVEFIKALVEQTGCGVLLDVNNVWVNAMNHGYDAKGFIDQIPPSSVFQYHMAGHDASGEFIVDTHSDHAIDEVLDLYAYALNKIGPAWTVYEWDNNIPPLNVLLDENKKVRGVGQTALGLHGGRS